MPTDKVKICFFTHKNNFLKVNEFLQAAFYIHGR